MGLMRKKVFDLFSFFILDSNIQNSMTMAKAMKSIEKSCYSRTIYDNISSAKLNSLSFALKYRTR